MTIAALASAAVLATAPGAPPGDRPRLEALGRDVAAAVLRAPPGPWHGPKAREAAALALVAIGAHESGWRPEVVDCRVRGDLGEVTAWQLLGPWALGDAPAAEACAAPTLAAELALGAFARHAGCAAPAAAFRGYASGSCGRDSQAARDMCAAFDRLAALAGVRASCGSWEAS